MFLEKIETQPWIDFITERFSATGKSISAKLAERISSLAANHPYYVQQLAQQVWLRTTDKATETIVSQAHESLVQQLSLLFVTMTEGLSSLQINLLQAIIAGEKSQSSAATMAKYRLGSSANITRSRKSLIEKDILDNRAGVIDFQDPIYQYWLATYYFGK